MAKSRETVLLVMTYESLRTESGRACLLRWIGGRSLKTYPSIIQPNYINSLIQSVGLMTRLFEGGLLNNSWASMSARTIAPVQFDSGSR